MRKLPRLPALAINLILVISLIAIWIAFAPLRIGGQATYAIVSGHSMEPGFHPGDLAIARVALIYNVGDIVVYRDSYMNAYVIHRIIGFEQNYFVMKGDNNSWIDLYHPTQDEIIGKLWIHVPNLGLAIQWLRMPINMALIMGLLGGVFMASMTVQPNQSKKAKNKISGNPAGAVEITLYSLGFLCLVFVGLSIFSFSRPTMRTADDIKYQQTGVFFYSAAGKPEIYDTDTVRSGEPIFPKLTCSLNVGFVYNITGSQLQGISGSQHINAYISDEQSGWQRTIPLNPEATFNSETFSSKASIDLCQVQALVSTVEEETGFHPSTYTLNIVPYVTIMGKSAGQELYDTFESKLTFKFDKVHFFLVSDSKNATDPLRSSKQSKISSSETQENKISFLGMNFNVLDVRMVSLIGLEFSFSALLFSGIYLWQIAKRNQQAYIGVKYGSIIMNVYERGFENISPVIDVETIDDLAKLAERQNAMILHMTRNYLHYYLVQSEGTTYRYVISVGHGNSSLKKEAPNTANLD